jgi:hypothetical protein
MTTTENPATPLPFLLPAANLAPGDVVPDNQDAPYLKGFTIASVQSRAGMVEVICTDHARVAFAPDCLVEVTNRRPTAATSGGFDTYCAWCQQEWTKHVGGKPGVPGGPSTCPSSSVG